MKETKELEKMLANVKGLLSYSNQVDDRIRTGSREAHDKIKQRIRSLEKTLEAQLPHPDPLLAEEYANLLQERKRYAEVFTKDRTTS